jgi:hypothetical protein
MANMEYLLATLIFIFGLGVYTENHAEKEIKKIFQEEIKSAKDIKVNIKKNNIFSFLAGKAPYVKIQGKNFYQDGVRAYYFEIIIKNPLFSFFSLLFKKKVKNIPKIEEVFYIKENDFTSYLKKRTKEIKNLKVSFLSNKMVVSGNLDIPLISPSFSIEAKLSVKNNRELWAFVPKVKLGFIPFPRFVINLIFKDINPVYVLDEKEAESFLKKLKRLTNKKYKIFLKNVILKKGEMILKVDTMPE